MSKGLEALENIGFEPLYQNEDGSFQRVRDENKEDFEIIEKELKALDIINKKDVQIWWLKDSDSCAHYNRAVGTNQRLKRTEYDLVKGVLTCEK